MWGVFTRCERMVVLVFGIFTHLLTPALWVLAVVEQRLALQRVFFVLRATGQKN